MEEDNGETIAIETRLYDLLEVEPNATECELKLAFKRTAKKYHPDKNAAGNERMKDIYFARDTLFDERKRKYYDKFGEESLSLLIEEEMTLNGENTLYDEWIDETGVRNFRSYLEVTLEDLCLGTVRASKVKLDFVCDCVDCVETDEFCEKCKGTKIFYKQKTLYIRIPFGARNGYILRYDIRYPRSTPTRVTVILKELKHPVFERRGDDLNMNIKLDWVEAVTYFDKVIKGVDRNMIHVRKLKTQQRTMPDGEKMVIHGAGLPNFENPAYRGVINVTYHLNYPKSLTPHQMEVLKNTFPTRNATPSFQNVEVVELKTLPAEEVSSINQRLDDLMNAK